MPPVVLLKPEHKQPHTLLEKMDMWKTRHLNHPGSTDNHNVGDQDLHLLLFDTGWGNHSQGI